MNTKQVKNICKQPLRRILERKKKAVGRAGAGGVKGREIAGRSEAVAVADFP